MGHVSQIELGCRQLTGGCSSGCNFIEGVMLDSRSDMPFVRLSPCGIVKPR
jgi:hypothetical protein